MSVLLGDLCSIEVVGAGEEVGQVIRSTVKAKKEDDEDYQDSFFVADVDRLMDLYDTWNAMLPKIHPFYAVKCNPEPALLKLLASLGTGFDCASKNEIQTVLDLGVSPDHIIFNNPFKPIAHLKHAAKCGVRQMTFDCEMELQKIKQFYPSASLIIRLKPISLDAYNPVKMEGINYKFGCQLEEAKALLLKAKALDLEVMGVSFHLGVGVDGVSISSSSSYIANILNAEKVICYMEELGYRCSILDIGGGIAGHSDQLDNVRQWSVSVHECVEQVKARHSHLNRVIAEPGQFFCRSVYTLAVSVICKKRADDGSTICILSEGKYNTFNMLTYFLKYPLKPRTLKGEEPSDPEQVYLWGPCMASDLVAKCPAATLPQLEQGDWLFFEDMGAYSISLFMPFNGVPKPKIHYFIRSSRRKEAVTRLHLKDENILQL